MAKQVERRLTAILSTHVSLPHKLSVAALPFANMSTYPEQEFFADGVATRVAAAHRVAEKRKPVVPRRNFG